MSGVMRLPVLRSGATAAAAVRCHGGRSNSVDMPPPVPCDSGTSNQVCSDTHLPSRVGGQRGAADTGHLGQRGDRVETDVLFARR